MAWGTMSRCDGGGGGGSVALERPLRLWSLLIESVRCGGGAQRPNRRNPKPGSDKLSELLKRAEWWENEESEAELRRRRKEEALERLKGVARKLQEAAEGPSVVEGAAEVRRLTKDDPEARATLALLGVIPPLVALLDAQDPTFRTQIAALYALLNLAIANDGNKAAIVKSGAVHKILKLIQTPPHNPEVAEAAVANFLGLSALDSNKPIIGSSGAIPFLVNTLKDSPNPQAKQDALRAFCNLSISPTNTRPILDTDLIPHLLSELGCGGSATSNRILSILANIVSVADGRRRIASVPDTFPLLVDVLGWTDSPECQEKASYILMVMAHKSYADRQAIIEAGAVSALLELTLLGSVLAQKRASRMLELLRVDKGKQIVVGGGGGNVSAPLMSSPSPSTFDRAEEEEEEEEEETMSHEKRAVRQLVQQSLHTNMKRMVERANLPHDFVPSEHLKALTSGSSTSKSLPF
ncbi:ARM repeat superfamily protein [Striga hermonthica]|uniref:ARM repeat superfamily protein n=1 Tax=Striga hermonthica TaxID=68872 RepID=A0A9N7NEW8_STRHE|nr:ARM repeat superfamily protein [Striga hermonthica]